MKRVTIFLDKTGQHLLTVKSRAALRAIADDMKSNGCELDNPALGGTIAISESDAYEFIGHRRLCQFWRAGGEITITIDDWALRQIFGYCSR